MAADYTREQKFQFFLEIHDFLSKGGTILKYCEQPNTPNRASIGLWAAQDPELGRILDRAYELRADHWFEEAMRISDESRGESRDVVLAARLQVDTRKWAAAKQNRKKYGDHQSLEHTGKDGGPVAFTGVDRTPAVTREQWLANVAKDLERKDLEAKQVRGEDEDDGA